MADTPLTVDTAAGSEHLNSPPSLPPRTSSLADDVPDPSFPAPPYSPASHQFHIADDLVFAYIGLVWLLAESEETALGRLIAGNWEVPPKDDEEDVEHLTDDELSEKVSTASLLSEEGTVGGEGQQDDSNGKGFWSKVTSVFESKDSETDPSRHPSVISYRTWRQQLLQGIATSNALQSKELDIIKDLSNHGVTIESLTQSLSSSIKAAASAVKAQVADGTDSDQTVKRSDERDAISLILSNLIFSSLQETVMQSSELRYDARLRTILRRLSLLIWDGVYDADGRDEMDDSKARGLMVQEVEHIVAEKLWEESHIKRQDNNGTVPQLEETREKWKRWAGVGLATVGGGVVIGLTGGLAAPMIGAGLGGLFSGLGLAAHAGLCATLGTTAGVAIVGTLFGVTGGGLTAYRFNRRLGSLSVFAFHSLTPPPNPHAGNSNTQSLHLIIPISGWLTTESDITDPWTVLPAYAPFSEVTALSFDPHHLLDLGKAFQSFMKSTAVTYGTTTVLKQTMLAGLMSALVWPVGLLQMGYLVDNPWTIGLDRARKAGLVLARDVLAKYVQGKRPVTLIGWSLGARTIFYCLLELSKMKAYGIVDEAYLLGAPVGVNPLEWRQLASVVSGRVVNGYAKGDWFLSYLYRASQAKNGVAGLRKIRIGECEKGRNIVDNVDLSDIVKGHLKYRDTLPEILERVGFERGVSVSVERAREMSSSRSSSTKAGEDELLWSLPPVEPSVTETANSVA
ncbi:hypothetical protein SpCBS45565_g02177 [Spizellomyces sp. 'palustris']|nr:hypothetical protein SpCBS45565_g02177 [Spizellomyces sp. 'palustris']